MNPSCSRLIRDGFLGWIRLRACGRPLMSRLEPLDIVTSYYGRRSLFATSFRPCNTWRGKDISGNVAQIEGRTTLGFCCIKSRIIHSFTYDRDTGVVSSLAPATTSRETQPPASSALTPTFQSVIGIEIHAQLSIPTKLFSDAPTRHSAADPKPNEWVELYDLAYPGSLPNLSASAVQAAVISAAALGCRVNEVSRFERKHYFYADLPSGYQVTQQRWPVGSNGLLKCRNWIVPDVGRIKKKQKKRRRGQQISKGEEKKQRERPMERKTPPEKFFEVGVDRVQIEQDTGKTTNVVEGLEDGASITRSLVDLNRAGCSLIEIVFRPDVRSAHQAASVVSTLQRLLRHVGTCDGKMEEGSLRCDLNVSVVPQFEFESKGSLVVAEHEKEGDNPFQNALPQGTGQRVEVKNLNSISQVIAAAEYEAIRQSSAFIMGSPTGRETRTFDVRSGQTVKIRSKGGAVDYRFMPEPDLPPLVLGKENLAGRSLQTFLADCLPELPEEAVSRLILEYGLTEDVALIITSDQPAIAMYESAVEVAQCYLSNNDEMIHQVPQSVANWLCNDLFALVKADSSSFGIPESLPLNHPISMKYSAVNAQRLGALVAVVLDGTISSTMGKNILSIMFFKEPELGPLDIAESRGWKIITDPVELLRLCKGVVHSPDNATQLEQYGKGGKHVKKIENFFVGKIMAASRGNAHPQLMLGALRRVLEQAVSGVKDS